MSTAFFFVEGTNQQFIKIYQANICMHFVRFILYCLANYLLELLID